MPVGSLKFIREHRYDKRTAIGLAIGGIPGVLLAAFVVKSLPLQWLYWLVVIVKLNVFLTDLGNFARVNETMARYFSEPFPARAAVGVKELPRGALVEADAVMFIGT